LAGVTKENTPAAPAEHQSGAQACRSASNHNHVEHGPRQWCFSSLDAGARHTPAWSYLRDL